MKWCRSSRPRIRRIRSRPSRLPSRQPERVAGVGRVGDQRVVAQRVDDLVDQPRLRVVRVDVEVARHRQRPVVRTWAAARRSRRSSGGSAKISDSSARVHGLGVGVAALGEEGQHAVDQVLGHAGARR